MDYPGTTTYEPTLVDLVVFLAGVTVLTYPCSLILISLGFVKPAKYGANRFSRTLRRANQILLTQLLPFFMAWLFGCLACTVVLFGWALIGGLFVAVGAMEPVDSVINTPLLVVMGSIHLLAQIIAYTYGIGQSSQTG